MIAFAVGVTCLLLSLNIVQWENCMDNMEESTISWEDAAVYDLLMQEVEQNDACSKEEIMNWWILAVFLN